MINVNLKSQLTNTTAKIGDISYCTENNTFYRLSSSTEGITIDNTDFIVSNGTNYWIALFGENSIKLPSTLNSAQDSIQNISKGYESLNQTGFQVGHSSVLSYDISTRKLTLARTIDYSIFTNGIEHRITSSMTTSATDDVTFFINGITTTGKNTITNGSIEFPSHPVTNKLYYYSINSDGTFSISDVFPAIGQSAIISMVSYDGTKGIYADERHECNIPVALHLYLHNTSGLRIESGFSINTGNTFPITTQVGMDYTIKGGIINDDGLRTFIETDSTYALSPTTKYTICRRNAVSPNTWLMVQDNSYPILSGTYIQYNNNGIMSDVTSNNYVNYYVCVTNFKDKGRFLIIPGQVQHTSTTTAYAESLSSLNLTGLPLAEFNGIYQITYRAGNYSVVGKCRIERIIKTNITNVVITGATAINDHLGLQNLNGGVYGDGGHTSMVTRVVSTVAPTTSDGLSSKVGSIWIDSTLNKYYVLTSHTLDINGTITDTNWIENGGGSSEVAPVITTTNLMLDATTHSHIFNNNTTDLIHILPLASENTGKRFLLKNKNTGLTYIKTAQIQVSIVTDTYSIAGLYAENGVVNGRMGYVSNYSITYGRFNRLSYDEHTYWNIYDSRYNTSQYIALLGTTTFPYQATWSGLTVTQVTDTIDGLTTIVLPTKGSYIEVESDGVTWNVIRESY